MLTKVEVRTDRGLLSTLSLMEVIDGVFVEDIDGLDPVKATLISSSFAQIDGEQYQSARREKRNLIFKLALKPDYSVEAVQAIRQRLYRFFMPKARLRMKFFVAGLPEPLDIVGRVESFDAPRFTQEPTATLSILCFDPDFVLPTPVVISGNTVSTTAETTHNYEGTVETGYLFTLNVNRNLSEFTIYHRPPDDSLLQLEFAAPTSLIAGDVLRISTITGNKYATLTRAGVNSSILFGISPQSNWVNMYEGPNKFRVYAEGAAVPFTIEYTTKIGAI